jgi:hypothetical protein
MQGYRGLQYDDSQVRAEETLKKAKAGSKTNKEAGDHVIAYGNCIKSKLNQTPTSTISTYASSR